MTKPHRLLLALLLVLTLALAACTGDAGDEGDPAADDGGTATATAPEPEEPTEPPTPQPRTSAPAEAVAVLNAEQPAALAVDASEALFDEAPMVVLAPADDPAALASAASAAVHLGTPLLLVDGGSGAAATDVETPTDDTPTDDTPDDDTATDDTADDDTPTEDAATGDEGDATEAAAAELERLGTTTVLAFGTAGDAAVPDGVEVLNAPADPEALADLLDVDGPRTVAGPELAEALAALRPGAAELLVLAEGEPEPAGDAAAPAEDQAADEPADAGTAESAEEPAAPEEPGAESTPAPGGTGSPAPPASPSPTPDAGATPDADATPEREAATTLPDHETAEPIEDLQVLLDAGEPAVAAVATALAAGAQPLVLDDPDPRADPAAIAALAEGTAAHQLVIGASFGEAEQVRQRLEVAATGVELPGGGQVLFPDRRFVALYGHPGSTALGALGEQPLDAAVERTREVAGTYEPHSEMAVVPTFEIITTIASASAQADNSYSSLSDIEHIRPWVDRAAEEGFYVVLDLQPGRTDFLTQAQHYEELLREPHVGLALDPEWRLRPDQVHLRQIGSVGADEVNSVVDWLAELTREHTLPQKLLVLHQFRHTMLPNREQIDTTRDELAVLVHMDGNGPPSVKRDTWRALTGEPMPGAWWGWKNFYDEDSPTMTPEETVAVEPPQVLFISYQ